MDFMNDIHINPTNFIGHVMKALESNQINELIKSVTEERMLMAVDAIKAQMEKEDIISVWSKDDIAGANNIIRFFTNRQTTTITEIQSTQSTAMKFISPIITSPMMKVTSPIVKSGRSPGKGQVSRSLMKPSPKKSDDLFGQRDANQSTISQYIRKLPIMENEKKRKILEVDLATQATKKIKDGDNFGNNGIASSGNNGENNVGEVIDHDDSEDEEQDLGGLIEDDYNKTRAKKATTISKQYKQEKEIPTGWYNVSHLAPKPMVMVGMENCDNVSDMMKEVKRVLDNEDENYGEIDEVSMTKRMVKISFINDLNRDTFCRYVNEFRPTWKCEIPKLRNPWIKVTGVESFKDLNDGELVDRIMKKNGYMKREDSTMIVKARRNTGNGATIIFEVPAAIRGKIFRNKGRMQIGFKGYEVNDCFNIKVCNRCLSYGHISCSQQIYCKYCGADHIGRCPVKDNKDKFFCKGCKGRGHQFDDPKCPQWENKIRYELNFINYTYEWIMATKLM